MAAEPPPGRRLAQEDTEPGSQRDPTDLLGMKPMPLRIECPIVGPHRPDASMLEARRDDQSQAGAMPDEWSVDGQNALQADLPIARGLVPAEHLPEDERGRQCQPGQHEEGAAPVQSRRAGRQQWDAHGRGQRTTALRPAYGMAASRVVDKGGRHNGLCDRHDGPRPTAPTRAARIRRGSVAASPVTRLLVTTASRQTSKVRRYP